MNEPNMIDLYTASTPNGKKISIMLEECELPYRVHLVNLGRGEQFQPDFVAINPNSKIPAIVDHDAQGKPIHVFESGAILVYLAHKASRLLPRDPAQHFTCLSWVFWQAANVGPMFGQANHFATVAPEKLGYAIDRFGNEAARLVRLMDDHLGRTPYLAGDYSIADIAAFPWLRVALDSICEARPADTGDARHIRRWLAEIAARPAVQRGLTVGRHTPLTEKTQ